MKMNFVKLFIIISLIPFVNGNRHRQEDLQINEITSTLEFLAKRIGVLKEVAIKKPWFNIVVAYYKGQLRRASELACEQCFLGRVSRPSFECL